MQQHLELTYTAVKVVTLYVFVTTDRSGCWRGEAGEGAVRREGEAGPGGANADQGGGTAKRAFWEDSGKAPPSGLRPGCPLPIIVVLGWMVGSQPLKKAAKGLTQEDIKGMCVGSGKSLRHHKGIVDVGLDRQERC